MDVNLATQYKNGLRRHENSVDLYHSPGCVIEMEQWLKSRLEIYALRWSRVAPADQIDVCAPAHSKTHYSGEWYNDQRKYESLQKHQYG